MLMKQLPFSRYADCFETPYVLKIQICSGVRFSKLETLSKASLNSNKSKLITTQRKMLQNTLQYYHRS